MNEQYSADEIQATLKELALYLSNEFYRSIFNDARTYLMHSGTFKSALLPENMSRDDVMNVMAFRLIEHYVFDSLRPVYIFYEESFDCIKWLKGILKSVDEGLADKLKSCWLSVLQCKRVFVNEREHCAQVLINELNAFDYQKSDATPIAHDASWIQFFTGGPAFKGVTGNPGEEILIAELAVRGLMATPEEALAKKIKKDPITAFRVMSELIPNSNILTIANNQAPYNVQSPAENESRKFESEIENTMARQVLVMHFLLEYAQVRQVDAAVKARLIHFLTGKNGKNIYDAVRSPFATKTKEFRKKDLKAIRPIFEDLGLSEIVKMINNELEKPSI